MALYINSNGTHAASGGLSVTASGLVYSAFTALAFWRLPSFSQWQTLIAFENTSNTQIHVLEVAPTSGQVDVFWGSVDVTNAGNMVAGAWMMVGFARSSNAVRIFMGQPPTLTFTTDTVSDTATFEKMTIGAAGQFGDAEAMSGQVHGLRVWSAALTDEEIRREARFWRAQRRRDLWGEWPAARGP